MVTKETPLHTNPVCVCSIWSRCDDDDDDDDDARRVVAPSFLSPLLLLALVSTSSISSSFRQNMKWSPITRRLCVVLGGRYNLSLPSFVSFLYCSHHHHKGTGREEEEEKRLCNIRISSSVYSVVFVVSFVVCLLPFIDTKTRRYLLPYDKEGSPKLCNLIASYSIITNLALRLRVCGLVFFFFSPHDLLAANCLRVVGFPLLFGVCFFKKREGVELSRVVPS